MNPRAGPLRAETPSRPAARADLAVRVVVVVRLVIGAMAVGVTTMIARETGQGFVQ